MDKYSQFCEEFAALLFKYEAEIEISTDYNNKPYISGAFINSLQFGCRPLVRETTICKNNLIIEPDNIGSRG